MPDSVKLSSLPYTGFDYGEVYNSLFWVVLLVWSFVFARFIVKYGGTKLVRVSAKREQKRSMVQAQDLACEPVVLEERVIRYQDPAQPINQQVTTATPQQTVKQVLSINNNSIPKSPTPILTPEVVEKVQGLVERELAVSRAGQTPDEFSAEDFATTDFDGVNPDVYWQPREVSNHSTSVKTTSVQAPTSAQPEVVLEPVQVQEPTPPPEPVKKVYKDTMTLDKSGEYPHMLIVRDEAAS